MSPKFSSCVLLAAVGGLFLAACDDGGYDVWDTIDDMSTHYGAGSYNRNITIYNDLDKPVTAALYSFHNADDKATGTARISYHELAPNQRVSVPLAFKPTGTGTDVGYVAFTTGGHFSEEPLSTGTVPVYPNDPNARTSQVAKWRNRTALEELSVAR